MANIINLEKSNSMGWYLDDESKKIIRVEPGIIFYMENDKLKIDIETDTHEFLNSIAETQPRSSIKNIGDEIEYVVSGEIFTSESMIINPKEHSLLVTNPVPTKIDLSLDEWKELISIHPEYFEKFGNVTREAICQVTSEEIYNVVDNIPKNSKIDSYFIENDKYVIILDEDTNPKFYITDEVEFRELEMQNILLHMDNELNYRIQNGESYIISAGVYLEDNNEDLIKDALIYKDNENRLILTCKDFDDVEIMFLPDTITTGENFKAIINNYGNLLEIEINANTSFMAKHHQEFDSHYSGNAILGLQIYLDEIEPNIPAESINYYLKDIEYNSDKNILDATRIFMNKEERIRISNPYLLDDETKVICYTDNFLNISKYTLDISDEEWNKLKSDIKKDKMFESVSSQDTVQSDCIRFFANIKGDNLDSLFLIQNKDGSVIDLNNIQYLNLEKGIVVGTDVDGEPFAKYFGDKKGEIEIGVVKMEDVVFFDIKNNILISSSKIDGEKDFNIMKFPDDNKKEFELLISKQDDNFFDSKNIYLKKSSVMENSEILKIVETISDKKYICSDKTIGLENVSFIKTQQGVDIKGINILDNSESIVHVHNIKVESFAGSKQLLIEDNMHKYFTINSFSKESEISTNSIKALEKEVSIAIGSHNMNDIFLLKGKDGVFIKNHDELMCITKMMEPSIPFNKAEIVGESRISSDIYRAIISEAAVNDIQTIVSEDSSSIMLIRTDTSNHSKLFNDKFTSKIDFLINEKETAVAEDAEKEKDIEKKAIDIDGM